MPKRRTKIQNPKKNLSTPKKCKPQPVTPAIPKDYLSDIASKLKLSKETVCFCLNTLRNRLKAPKK